jgi:hypothetical protein
LRCRTSPRHPKIPQRNRLLPTSRQAARSRRPHAHQFVEAFDELTGEWEGRQKIDREVEADSGRRALAEPWGALQLCKRLSLGAAVGVTVAQHIRASHPESKFWLTVSVGKSSNVRFASLGFSAGALVTPCLKSLHLAESRPAVLRFTTWHCCRPLMRSVMTRFWRRRSLRGSRQAPQPTGRGAPQEMSCRLLRTGIPLRRCRRRVRVN